MEFLKIVSNKRELLKTVDNYRKWQLGGLIILMVFGTFAELVSLGMALPFLGAITAPEKVYNHELMQLFNSSLSITSAEEILKPITVLFVICSIIAGGIRLTLLSAQTYLGNAIGNDLGSLAFKNILNQPYILHLKRNSSEIVAALMIKINTVINYILIPIISILTSSLVAIAIIIFLLLVNLQITLIALVILGGLYVVIGVYSQKYIKSNGQNIAIGQSALTKIIQEGLGGIRDIILSNLQNIHYKHFYKVDRKLRRAHTMVTIMSGAPRPIIETAGLSFVAVAGYMMHVTYKSPETAIPILGVFALACQRLMPLLQQGYAGWSSILAGQEALREILVLTKKNPKISREELNYNHLELINSIHIRNVFFKYEQKSNWVLEKIDLKISKGERIGITGTTGSGKSTFIDIMMGLLTPNAGEVIIDDIVINDENRQRWQSQIVHVPQRIFLTDATIAENIAFGIEINQIEMDRVVNAAKNAQIDETIKSFNDGYHTTVGERGVRLSGGQLQRIGIARALYKKANVMILDEATSALDDQTESSVMRNIRNYNNTTIIMIAHRLSTLDNCDIVYRMDDGKLKIFNEYKSNVQNS